MSEFNDSEHTIAARNVISAAISEKEAVRLHVPDPLGDPAKTRPIEGIARDLIAGKDGRERVVISVGNESESVEIRILLDRIIRAERIAGSPTAVEDAAAITRRFSAAIDDSVDAQTRKYPVVANGLPLDTEETRKLPRR